MINLNSGKWVAALACSLGLGGLSLIMSARSISAQAPCTMDCGPLVPTCVGEDQEACNWYCLDCALCDTHQTGITWFNVSTRGTTNGLLDVSLVPINCRVVKPCVNAPPGTNLSCSGWFSCLRHCDFSFGQTCSYCDAGTGTLLEVMSCEATSCPGS